MVEVNGNVSVESNIIADIIHGSMTIIIYEGKIVRCTPHRGSMVESMAPLTETNCVTPYRRHPLFYSSCSLAAASRNLSLSVPQAIINSRCTSARLILRGAIEQRELCPLFSKCNSNDLK